MKIEEIRNRPGSRAGKATKGTSSAATGKSAPPEETGFVEQLGRFVRGDGRQALDRLLARIDTAADRLGEQFTFENLYAYKSDVGKFLRAALDETYQPVLTEASTKTGKTKRLMTARLINEKIQALIDEVLRRQGPITGYMHQLDEIRGLLVDMYE